MNPLSYSSRPGGCTRPGAPLLSLSQIRRNHAAGSIVVSLVRSGYRPNERSEPSLSFRLRSLLRRHVPAALLVVSQP